MANELEDEPSGFILTRSFIEYFKDKYRIYRCDFNIDKVLENLWCIKKCYKVDTHMFTEYCSISWEDKKLIPKTLKCYDMESGFYGEVETESYIHEVWIKI